MNSTGNSSYKISVMSQREIQTAINWDQKEEWNPGANDASAFYLADPSGFLVGEYDNQPIATISAVKYGNSFGFIGLYIVNGEYRGKGFGLKIGPLNAENSDLAVGLFLALTSSMPEG